VLVENFPVALGVCIGVVAAVAGVFVFSMPMVQSPIDHAMLGSRPPAHLTTAAVRRAFGARGLPLRNAAPATDGVTLTGADPDLYVFVGRDEAGAAGRGDRSVANVLVHYGGADRAVRARVAAAVAALRGR
jgi:hypothetical protein